MNKNYQRGRNWEYQIIDKVKELYPDCFAGRNAGSHGFFDVWAIVEDSFSPLTGSLHLIQAKTGNKITNAHREEWAKMKQIKIPKLLTVKKEFWIKLPKNNIIAWGEEK